MRWLAVLVLLAASGCGFKAGSEGGSSSSGGSTSGSGSGTGSSTSSSSGGTGASSSGSSGGGTSSSSSSSSSGGTSASSSSSSGGTTGQSGDCRSSADCGGAACLEVTAGGYRQCQRPQNPPQACTGAGNDACCPDGSMSCPSGEACVLGPLTPYCGGVMMQPANVCAADQCQSDADCGSSSICAPAGTMGVQVKACVYAACKVDADCRAVAGGICAPVLDPCCNAVQSLLCVYPGGCRSNADCPNGYCRSDGHTASCQPGAPACPV